MKKILFILLVVVTFSSCKNDDLSQKWNSNAMINLRPANGTVLRSATIDTVHLTALEIVKQATNIVFWNDSIYGHQSVGRGFADDQRDTIVPCLKMYSVDIIHSDGTYASNFVEGTDCVIQRVRNLNQVNEIVDTIAYVPNSVLRAATIQIKAALSEQNYDKCYELFNTAFTFIPITGSEWKALKESGQE